MVKQKAKFLPPSIKIVCLERYDVLTLSNVETVTNDWNGIYDSDEAWF